MEQKHGFLRNAIRGSVTKEQIDKDPRIEFLVDRKNFTKHFCDVITEILGDEKSEKHAYISTFKICMVEFYNDVSNRLADIIKQNYFNPLHPKDDAGVTLAGIYTATGNKVGGRILVDMASIVKAKGDEVRFRRFANEVVN